MSTTIPVSHVQSYARMASLVFQRPGQFLKEAVRFEGGIVGKSHTFQKIGTGIATVKARHGNVVPMDLEHTAPSCSLVDFFAPEYVAPTDIERILHDEKSAVMQSGLYALGRKLDDQIITVLNTTSQSTITVVVTTEAAVRNGLITLLEALDDNDVPNDGQRFGILSPRMWSRAMTVKEFSAADYVGADGMAFTQGAAMHSRWKFWNGCNWKQHSATPGKGTSTAEMYVWHKRAVGYAAGAIDSNTAGSDNVAAKIDWIGEKYEWLVNHVMTGEACMIDDTGVIEGVSNDTTAIATT